MLERTRIVCWIRVSPLLPYNRKAAEIQLSGTAHGMCVQVRSAAARVGWGSCWAPAANHTGTLLVAAPALGLEGTDGPIWSNAAKAAA